MTETKELYRAKTLTIIADAPEAITIGRRRLSSLLKDDLVKADISSGGKE